MRELFLTAEASEAMRRAIVRAHGNEVCFVARVEEDGAVVAPRVVARGNRGAVNAAVRQAAPGMLVVHNHPSGELTPSDADLAVADRLHGQGLGLAIIDDAAEELYVVVEPAHARPAERLDAEEVEAALGPGGPLSEVHGGYEDRPAQRAMARRVTELFNEGGVALVEAGTGTGKSVAYLLPALLWARRNRERVVVSTNTINLQEQLVRKDLPLLRKALAEPFTFALVKGRKNYVSIRRAKLALATQGALFDGGQASELAALREWLDTTAEGSLQDLPFRPSAEVWDEVASETDVCLRAKCPHFRDCFYQKARRDAASADVLVVNHSLLFSDIAVRRLLGNYTAPAVLPPYKHVVLDEAHNLEEAATSHLGAGVTRHGMLRLLGRLDRRGRGVLHAVEERLAAGREDLLQQGALREIRDGLRPTVDRARRHANELFDQLEALTLGTEDGVLRLDSNGGSGRGRGSGNGGSAAVYGIAADVRPFRSDEPASWGDDGGAGNAALDGEPASATAFENLMIVLSDLAKKLDHLRETIRSDRRWAEALAEPMLELQGCLNRVRSAEDALRLGLAPGEDGAAMARWVERPGGGQRAAGIAVRAAPVEPGHALRESLFEPIRTTLLTSATLTTRDGFRFLRERLGLDAAEPAPSETAIPSPFAFETQTLLAVPTDLPAPRGGSDAAFDRATARVVEQLAGISDGGIFVLFTSYRSLDAVAGTLRRSGVAGRWPLFVQGEEPRASLLERFTASGRGILLGVASFWEGVDVPGEPLRGLVIPKLPFKVPAEPLTAARLERIERDGGSGFRSYLLPHAALRLKQGFGRLIRARTDRGAVVLLDRRILEKGYGRYLLGSLPDAPLATGAWSELAQTLERFYGSATGPREAPIPAA